MVKVRLFFPILLIIALTVSCSNKVEDKKPITLGMNVWPGYAFAFIARDKGIFEKNNVSVQLVLNKDISKSAEMYKNGELDGIFHVFSDIITFNAEGGNSKVVYVMDYSGSGDVIIGRPELNSLADLKGKVISFEGFNSFSHIFVLKALEKAGLKEVDLQFKNVLAMDVFTALEKGEIDAGHSWEPVTTKALNKGYKILGKAGDLPGIITDVLALNGEIVEKRPEAIQGIVKSMLEAREFLFSNREEAMEIMSKALKINKEEMEEGVRGVHIPDLKENIEAMKKSKKTSSLHGSGEFIADFLFNRGQLSQKPDIDKILEPRFLEKLTDH